MAKHPYNKLYLEDVQDNLGNMLEYAAECKLDTKTVWNMFVGSKVARAIEAANPNYLSGHSAPELLLLVLEENNYDVDKYSKMISAINYYIVNDLCYYWVGFALARLQYETGMTFKDINKYINMDDMLGRLYILHEADISKFLNVAEKIIKQSADEDK